MPDRTPSPLTDVDAVTFDAGYTLLHPTRNVAEVYWQTARCLGVELDQKLFGRRFQSCWSRLNADYRSGRNDLRSSDELERRAWHDFTFHLARPYPALAARHAEWLAALTEHFDNPNAWRPAESAAEVLAALAKRGLRIGVVTNWHSAIHRILDAHGLAKHCHCIVTSADAGRKKPHPTIFRTATERLGSAPARCVHVGDSHDEDVLGALACGMRAIHLRGPRHQDQTECGVDAIYSLADLIR